MAGEKEWVQFHLRVSGGDGVYRVDVISIDPRIPSASEEMRLTQEELAELRSVQVSLVAQASSKAREARPIVALPASGPEPLDAERFSELLTRKLFRGAVVDAFVRARGEFPHLAVSLQIEARDLAGLPWELLRDPTATHVCYLVLNAMFLLVRVNWMPVVDTGPRDVTLTMLVVAPKTLSDSVKRTFAQMARKNSFDFMLLEGEQSTFQGVHALLNTHHVQIFHFVGEGCFDDGGTRGEVVLHDGVVQVDRIAWLFRGCGVRFACLDLCRGTMSADADAFTGMVRGFAAAGVPAVLVMQHVILDDVAGHFAEVFYKSIGRGDSVSMAMYNGRVVNHGPTTPAHAWAMPVLYLNGADGPLIERSDIEDWTWGALTGSSESRVVREHVRSVSRPQPPPPPPPPNAWISTSDVLRGVARMAAAEVIRSIRRRPTTPPSSIRLDAALPRLTVYRSSWWAPRTDISLYVAVALPGAESEARTHARAAIDRPGNAMRENQSLPVPRALRDQELLRCELDASFVTVKRAAPRPWSAPCTVLVISAVVASDAPLGEHQVTLRLFGEAESDAPAALRVGDELLAEVVFRVEVREAAARAENQRRTAGALLSAAGVVGLATLVLQHGEVPMVAQAAASGTALVGGIVVLTNAEAPVAPTAVVPAGVVSVLYDRPDAAYALLAFDALQRSGLVSPAPAAELFSARGASRPPLDAGCVVVFWSRRARASNAFTRACGGLEHRLRSGGFGRTRVIVVSLDHDLPDSTSALSRAPRFTLPLAPVAPANHAAVAEAAPRGGAGAVGAPTASEDPFVKFDLEVNALAGGSYSVVLAAGRGWAKTAPQVTAPPVCRCELMRAALRCRIAAETRSGARRDAVAVKLIQETTCRVCGLRGVIARDGEERPQAPQLALGRELAEMIFHGEIADHYHTAAAEGRPVRVRLSLPDDLTGVPWEVMTAPSGSTPLSLTGTTHVVRMASAPLLPHLRPGATLRVLALGATPTNRPRLDVEGEEEWLDATLTQLQQTGKVERKWIGDGRWDLLHEALIAQAWDVFHFAGHGGVGEVSLCAVDGTEVALPAADLAQLLLGRRIRVVVLNCCKGAAGDEVDRIASTAKVLAERGVPAVVAMQSAISDRGAVDFARSFYLALAARRPIEDAVAEARRALARGDGEEWMTPVLYLNADDGRLLERA